MYPSLVAKYNVPVPRYTSYPPVPHWDSANCNRLLWENEVKNQIDTDNQVSVYIHIPYCESLCTYCGCNKKITTNHAVEGPYVQTLIKEWDYYLGVFGKKPVVKELHFGGGTPTFLSAEHLQELVSHITNSSETTSSYSYSIEAHPNYTNQAQLTTLASLGIDRISLGVQDFDPVVQKAIHRVQTFEQTQKIASIAQKVGIKNLNIDLVYGLPFQTLNSITNTIHQTMKLKPSRIAFYGYAHVPWKSKSQRGFSDQDIPQDEAKRALFETGVELITQFGYVRVGMDHFALPTDEIAIAQENKMLHRNFMGYTTQNTQLLIGLGASAISDSGTAYIQNPKDVAEYMIAIENQNYQIETGHMLTSEELIIKKHIQNLMCNFETSLDLYTRSILPRLQSFISDKLVTIDGESIKVTNTGKLFIRNIANCWDKHFQSYNNISQLQFSKAI